MSVLYDVLVCNVMRRWSIGAENGKLERECVDHVIAF